MLSLAGLRNEGIPEDTAFRMMSRHGSELLRAAIYRHFDLPVPGKQKVRIASTRLEPHQPAFGSLLLGVVAKEYGLTVAQALEKDRSTERVEVRALVADVLKGRGWSYPQIGRLLSLDHSTVINLVRRVPAYCERSERFAAVHAALDQYRRRRDA